MVPTFDAATSIIILTGYQETSSDLYFDVLNALKEINDPQPVQNLWLPSFSLQADLASDYLQELSQPSLPTVV